MSHFSENTNRLEKINIHKDIKDISCNEPCVSFVNLPYYEKLVNIPTNDMLYISLNRFIKHSNTESIIAILCSPVFAADYCSQLSKDVHIKLWIAVKLLKPIERNGNIPNHHLSLLILSKSRYPLKHTKTRIGYTYCSSCQKTTKDYGGKKHLYHEYGTLMSDVWRDISIEIDRFPLKVVDRLQDIFGLKMYSKLNVIDQREYYPSVINNYEIPTELNHANNYQFMGLHDPLLINGDCLNALSKIPDDSIDFCFADPPYNLKKKYQNFDDNFEITHYFEWCDYWLSEIARILKPGRTCAILNIPIWCVRHFKYLTTKLEYQDWIVWEGLSLPVRMIMPAHYTILCFSKGKPRKLPGTKKSNKVKIEKKSLKTVKEFYCSRPNCVKTRKKNSESDLSTITNLWWDIHRLKHNSRRVDHPCQLPPTIMYRLISLFTYEHELVLDPFNGVGTTTLAAHQLNRNYIGIELSHYYHRIAEVRHKEIQRGLDPFRKTNKTPTAKNSYVKRLKKQQYKVSKKTLQLEVKKISKKLNRIPTRQDVIDNSNYPIEYFDNYFINWAEVCAAARTTGMSESKEAKSSYDFYNPQQSLEL